MLFNVQAMISENIAGVWMFLEGWLLSAALYIWAILLVVYALSKQIAVRYILSVLKDTDWPLFTQKYWRVRSIEESEMKLVWE